MSRVWKNRGRHGLKRRTSSRQALVAKSSASASAAAAGVSATIARSKLVEQLRDYRIGFLFVGSCTLRGREKKNTKPPFRLLNFPAGGTDGSSEHRNKALKKIVI